ncbi:MAG: DUF262 domain-containing protein [Anaerolineae bacterium]
MKISELLDAIRTRDAVLPEFQREYVWNKEQAKQLLVSLAKDYPVGGLLFWRTDHPPELKNIAHVPDKLGALDVILDGQQRLTTLYMMIEGAIPPYYREADIQNDPRDLYYSLDTGEFEYYSSRMQNSPVWRRVLECFSEPVNVFQLASETVPSDDSMRYEVAQRYQNNLERLKGIKSIDLPVQLVPSSAGISDAIDVFDRVNSQGTKLTDAELALTHVTGKWSQARRTLKSKMDALEKRGFEFDLTFMTRALTGTVTRRALFEFIHDVPRSQLEEGWGTLSKILDYLVTMLPTKAHIHSAQDLNTTNVLVPLVVYLAVHDGKFASDVSMRNAIHWLYAAHTWTRYTSQTDQRLEQDVSLVVRAQNPWDSLRDQIMDQRGRIEVKPADLEGRGAQHPMFKMMAILAKASGAVDWFNGAPLGSTFGKAYSIQSHHIFPASLLYGGYYDSESHMHRKVVNELANRAFLTAESNKGLAAKAPEEYLPIVEKNYPGALAAQFIPMDPSLWPLDRYDDFLEARRVLIADRLNIFMSSLISEPEQVAERPVAELIEYGESATLEFKSSLQWDMVQKQANQHLRYEVLRAIAAFLNSAGGTLLIGVEDDGNVCGIANDLKIVGKSPDKFQQLLVNLISDRIAGHIGNHIRIRFEQIAGQTVCVVNVDSSLGPVFLNEASGKAFYTRFGNTSRLLDAEESNKFIQERWE